MGLERAREEGQRVQEGTRVTYVSLPGPALGSPWVTEERFPPSCPA